MQIENVRSGIPIQTEKALRELIRWLDDFTPGSREEAELVEETLLVARAELASRLAAPRF